MKKNINISFRVIGSGYFFKETEEFIKTHHLSNVEFLSKYLSGDELISKMGDADLMLGQFESNPRLNRTIPHKAFEAMAMGIPYLTGDGMALKEIAEEGKNAFFVPLANPRALAEKINFLASEPELMLKVAINAKIDFDRKFASHHLVECILQVL